MKARLEVCSGDIESVWAAQKGGAYRVELCSGLNEGGLTPSWGFIKSALEVPDIKKHVLIRPRGGDFLYTPREKKIMFQDVEMAKGLGVDGVVVGALTSSGHIDTDFVKSLIEAASGMDVTFHRAFDLCSEPISSFRQIMDLGCTRLLSSGQAATAEKGIPLLRKLVEISGNEMSVMPGCGVNAKNAARILSLTGASEIHASARAELQSRMEYCRVGVEMGKPGEDEFLRMTTSERLVEDIVRTL